MALAVASLHQVTHLITSFFSFILDGVQTKSPSTGSDALTLTSNYRYLK